MSLLQRLAAITDTAANLKAQLFELERLREQVGEALLSVCFSRAFHDAFFNEPPDEKADRKFLRGLIRAMIA